MYLGVDVGGTKTLVASLTDEGVITESKKFPTPKRYDHFLLELKHTLMNFKHKDFRAIGVAVPGIIDRKRGMGIAYGNLPWKKEPIQADIEKMTNTPVVLDNDANLAALSEAMLLKDKYSVVLYVTIGTGIGTGIIVNCKIDETFQDAEGGHMLFEHKGRLVKWESFASGKAIYRRFGKKASEITAETTWKTISRDLALGLQSLIAMVQPEVIVLGGGIATHLPKYKKYLVAELKKYETPLVEIPPIRKAQRPEEAVVYGCYDLAKERFAHARTR